ncbi:MAG: hypothetical protein EOM02_14515 [Synergistales bacterium]|nr:hypothetical protein [Synergistales bacterium]
MLNNISLTLIVSFLLVVGQMLWKKGLSLIGSLNIDIETLGKLAKSPWIVAGCFLYAFSTLLWFKVLSSGDFSKVYPLMSISYLMGMVGGAVVWGETLSIQNWLGGGLLIVSIFLISK